MVKSRGLLALFVSIFSFVASEGSGPSCTELGFKETLICSSCTDLATFVPDQDLFAECKRCCAEENEKTVSIKYSAANLIVCS